MRASIDLSKIGSAYHDENITVTGDPVRDAFSRDAAVEWNRILREHGVVVYPSSLNLKTNLMKVYHDFGYYSLVDFNRMIMYSFQCKRKPKIETQLNTFDIERLQDKRWVIRHQDWRVGLDRWLEMTTLNFQPNMVTMEDAYLTFKDFNAVS